jgi:GTP-binding protein
LIEGAHEGLGLGDRFLGHVERTRVLLHLVDASGEHAGAAYKTVRGELEAYGHGLAEKQEIVALSKTDIVDEETLKKQIERLKRAMRAAGPPMAEGERRKAPLLLSAAARTGVTDVLRAIAAHVETERRAEKPGRAKAAAWAP